MQPPGSLNDGDEVEADTKADTLAGAGGDRGSQEIEDAEDGSSNEGKEDDLLEGKWLRGEEVSDDRNNQTLYQVFHKASQQLVRVKGVVHGIYTLYRKSI